MYHLTPKSGNGKTGPIAVTTSTRDNCPDTCPLKASGCYAKGGPLAIHWAAVTSGKRGVSLRQHMLDLLDLPASTMVRLNQAGDLPPDTDDALDLLRAACHKDRIAWTYSHHTNLAWIDRLNDGSKTTVNVSANGLAHADAVHAQARSPICAVVPEDAINRRAEYRSTPAGLPCAFCPATLPGSTVTCATCGNGKPLCARKRRAYVILFPAHGSGRKAASRIAS